MVAPPHTQRQPEGARCGPTGHRAGWLCRTAIWGDGWPGLLPSSHVITAGNKVFLFPPTQPCPLHNPNYI